MSSSLSRRVGDSLGKLILIFAAAYSSLYDTSIPKHFPLSHLADEIFFISS
jgi:hypothetical protein